MRHAAAHKNPLPKKIPEKKKITTRSKSMIEEPKKAKSWEKISRLFSRSFTKLV
jgi:hypothetical protein